MSHFIYLLMSIQIDTKIIEQHQFVLRYKPHEKELRCTNIRYFTVLANSKFFIIWFLWFFIHYSQLLSAPDLI